MYPDTIWLRHNKNHVTNPSACLARKITMELEEVMVISNLEIPEAIHELKPLKLHITLQFIVGLMFHGLRKWLPFEGNLSFKCRE